jgi:DNA polymerase III subunit epsilon
MVMKTSDAKRLLEAHPDYRILRRVPPTADWGLARSKAETRRAVLIDTETTGLGNDTDEVIELAVLPFEYERDTGLVVSVDEAHALSAFREPSRPIPDEATKVHGITDEMVRGQLIDAERLRAIVEPAQLVIAHNAGFDRPMVEKHWPIFEDKHWACTFVDIDWKSEAVGSAKLDYLLYAQGWFHDGHRALSDALATLFLLTLPLPQSKKLGMAALLESARRPLRAVRAEETAFEQRAALKARGYRWDEGKGKRAKAWWIMTSDPDAELAWLRSEIYGDERTISVVNVPPTRRYSSRLWPD